MYHAMKTYSEGCFTLGETAPDRGWMGTRASLDTMVKRKILVHFN